MHLPMTLFSFILMSLGVGFVAQAHYFFIANTRYTNQDLMGASFNFDLPFAFGAICICVAIGVAGWLWWPFCILLFVALVLLGPLYKWMILYPLLGPFRIPSPPND